MNNMCTYMYLEKRLDSNIVKQVSYRVIDVSCQYKNKWFVDVNKDEFTNKGSRNRVVV